MAWLRFARGKGKSAMKEQPRSRLGHAETLPVGSTTEGLLRYHSAAAALQDVGDSSFDDCEDYQYVEFTRPLAGDEDSVHRDSALRSIADLRSACLGCKNGSLARRWDGKVVSWEDGDVYFKDEASCEGSCSGTERARALLALREQWLGSKQGSTRPTDVALLLVAGTGSGSSRRGVTAEEPAPKSSCSALAQAENAVSAPAELSI